MSTRALPVVDWLKVFTMKILSYVKILGAFSFFWIFFFIGESGCVALGVSRSSTLGSARSEDADDEDRTGVVVVVVVDVG